MTGGQQATDPAGTREAIQAPGSGHRRVLAQRRGPGTEIGEIFDPREQAKQKGQQLGGGRMLHAFLGNGHLRQLREKPQGLGEMAPDDEHRVLGRLASVQRGMVSMGHDEHLLTEETEVANTMLTFDRQKVICPLVAQKLGSMDRPPFPCPYCRFDWRRLLLGFFGPFWQSRAITLPIRDSCDPLIRELCASIRSLATIT